MDLNMPEWCLMVDICGDEVEPLGCMVEWVTWLSDYVFS